MNRKHQSLGDCTDEVMDEIARKMAARQRRERAERFSILVAEVKAYKPKQAEETAKGWTK